MPSKSPAQHRLMAAILHGWKPPGKNAPSPAVAAEFIAADKAKGQYQGKKRK